MRILRDLEGTILETNEEKAKGLLRDLFVGSEKIAKERQLQFIED